MKKLEFLKPSWNFGQCTDPKILRHKDSNGSLCAGTAGSMTGSGFNRQHEFHLYKCKKKVYLMKSFLF